MAAFNQLGLMSKWQFCPVIYVSVCTELMRFYCLLYRPYETNKWRWWQRGCSLYTPTALVCWSARLQTTRAQTTSNEMTHHICTRRIVSVSATSGDASPIAPPLVSRVVGISGAKLHSLGPGRQQFNKARKWHKAVRRRRDAAEHRR